MRDQLRNVDPFGIVDATFPIGHRDDLCADGGKQLGGDRSDVAKTLYGNRCALDVEAEMLGGFARHNHHAASCCLATT
jgi:hypothetical protein